MYRYLRFAAHLLAVFCFIICFNSTALSQENALKSKYAYTTSALESAQKLYTQRKYPEALSAYDAIVKQAENQQNYEELVYAMEKKALVLRKLNRYDEAIATMDRAIVISLTNLPKGHFLVAKTYDEVRDKLQFYKLDGYIGKPFTQSQVFETIMSVLSITQNSKQA